MPPTYYRGCWHVVSRGLFFRYRHARFRALSSLTKKVYNPKTFFPHAASLGQASAHCPIFPTAASRRSLDRFSVPMRPFDLSVRLPIVGLVCRCHANCLIGREPIFQRIAPLTQRRCRLCVLCGISAHFYALFLSERQVAHVLLARPPLMIQPKPYHPFDLNVLCTPPAFILSQDQTL